MLHPNNIHHHSEKYPLDGNKTPLSYTLGLPVPSLSIHWCQSKVVCSPRDYEGCLISP